MPRTPRLALLEFSDRNRRCCVIRCEPRSRRWIIGKTKPVPDLPAHPHLGANARNRSKSEILCKHKKVSQRWNIDKVLGAHPGEGHVNDAPFSQSVAVTTEIGSLGVQTEFLGAHTHGDFSTLSLCARYRYRNAKALHIKCESCIGRRNHRACKEIRLPKKVRDKLCAGQLIDFFGGPHLFDAALVHDRNCIRHDHRLLLVVGDVQERQPHIQLNGLSLDLHLPVQLKVKCAKGFVYKQDCGAVNDGSGKSKPLLLTSRKLLRFPLGKLLELNKSQRPSRFREKVLNPSSTQTKTT